MQEGEGRGTALEGLLVLELCSFVAGPFCAKLLADMGADVIKVEPPGAGDESRGRGPFYHAEAESDVSLLFVYLNANKRGITLNVDAPEGRDLLHSLLGRVDVLIEDLPSGDLDRLGLGYPSLHQPIHQIAMPHMGLWLLDDCNLEELAAACLERGRWEFLLTVAPLRIQYGTGSPVNPIAVF